MAGTVPEYVSNTVAASSVCWLSGVNTTTCIIMRILDFRRMWVCIWRILTTEYFFFRNDSKLFLLQYLKHVFWRVTVPVTVVFLFYISLTLVWLQRIAGFPVPVQA